MTVQELQGISRDALKKLQFSELDFAAFHRRLCFAIADFISASSAMENRSGPSAKSAWAENIRSRSTELLLSLGWNPDDGGPIVSRDGVYLDEEARSLLRSGVPRGNDEAWSEFQGLLFRVAHVVPEQFGAALDITDGALRRLSHDLRLISALAARLAAEQSAQIRHGGREPRQARRLLMHHLLSIYEAISGSRPSGFNSGGPTVRWLVSLFSRLRLEPDPELAELPIAPGTVARWIVDSVKTIGPIQLDGGQKG